MEQQQVGGEILKPGPLLLQGTITDAHHGDPEVLIEVDAGRRAPKGFSIAVTEDLSARLPGLGGMRMTAQCG